MGEWSAGLTLTAVLTPIATPNPMGESS
jgi:hypothetical protein